jgi:hypothetical protein
MKIMWRRVIDPLRFHLASDRQSFVNLRQRWHRATFPKRQGAFGEDVNASLRGAKSTTHPVHAKLWIASLALAMTVMQMIRRLNIRRSSSTCCSAFPVIQVLRSCQETKRWMAGYGRAVATPFLRTAMPGHDEGGLVPNCHPAGVFRGLSSNARTC